MLPKHRYLYLIIPLLLTFVVCIAGIGALYVEILLLNHLTGAQTHIMTQIRWTDVLVGITIYLKTSIDFAIFIGRLMHTHRGLKNRILIEIGTALGNISGTILILLIWDIFREVIFLMAIMILLSALVLLRMAEEGLDHVKDEEGKYKISFGGLEIWLEMALHKFNSLIAPVLGRIVPQTDMKEGKRHSPIGIFILAASIPFILGLDDFAGYIPFFNIVNVLGFATGIFIGHMALNIALFSSPRLTIRIVKNPLISFLGSLAFIGLALLGIIEVVKLLAHI